MMGASVVYTLDMTILAPRRQSNGSGRGRWADAASNMQCTHMQVVAVLRAAEATPAAGAPTWDHGTAQAFDGSGPRGHGTPVQRGSSEEEAAAPVRFIGAEREALYKMYSEHIEARARPRKYT